MPLTLDLPPHLHKDLSEEAEKEGVAPSEHAALLLAIFTALLKEVEPTPFTIAVQRFMSHRSIDAHRVSSVLGELVEQCMAGHEQGNESDEIQNLTGNSDQFIDVDEHLRQWRNALVHEPIDESFDEITTSLVPLDPLVQKAGRQNRAMGKYSHIPGSSDDFARAKREEISLGLCPIKFIR
jgi:hypothetical protein